MADLTRLRKRSLKRLVEPKPMSLFSKCHRDTTASWVNAVGI